MTGITGSEDMRRQGVALAAMDFTGHGEGRHTQAVSLGGPWTTTPTLVTVGGE